MNNPNNQNDELREQIELGKALDRLKKNDDFILVIKQSYINDVLMKKSQGMLDVNPVFRQEALEQIQSVNYLRKHLTDIEYIADGASQDFEQEEA